MITRRQAKRAVELHGEELADYPNVVALGVSRLGDVGRPASERNHALAVYVTDKKPAAELDAGAVLPGYVEIPGRGTTHKVAVQVIEIGELDRQAEERGHSAFSAE